MRIEPIFNILAKVSFASEMSNCRLLYFLAEQLVVTCGRGECHVHGTEPGRAVGLQLAEQVVVTCGRGECHVHGPEPGRAVGLQLAEQVVVTCGRGECHVDGPEPGRAVGLQLAEQLVVRCGSGDCHVDGPEPGLAGECEIRARRAPRGQAACSCPSSWSSRLQLSK